MWDPATQLRLRRKGKPPAYPQRPSEQGEPVAALSGG